MIRIGMSSSCVYPLPLREAFRLARIAGFDGIEIMVTAEKATQDAGTLRALSREYGIPVLSIHAPVLLLTQFVWGTNPQVKLQNAAGLAREVGASTVVVHPPFRWQALYSQSFESIVRATSEHHGVEIAVENMFGIRVGDHPVRAYSPSPDPTQLDVDAMTLDFSHAAVAGRDSLELALAMGDRLRHVHLTDGMGGTLLDEHLVPGRGSQPVAEVLAYLAGSDWQGTLAAEVKTSGSDEHRLAALRETLFFARAALGSGRTVHIQRHESQRPGPPDPSNRHKRDKDAADAER
jgi:sugar phosphate isomerase/epimerase